MPPRASDSPTAKTVKLNYDSLYEMTVRNSYYVPARKCPFVTVNYLIGVKNGEVDCPKYAQIRRAPCPTPPRKAELVATLMQVGEDMDLDFGLAADGPMPNTAWLLDLLSTYEPGHRYFTKLYRPAKEKPERQLDNDDGFFDGLPPALTQSKAVRRSQVIKRLLKPLPGGPPARGARAGGRAPEERKQESPARRHQQSSHSANTQLTPDMKNMSMGSGGKRNYQQHSGQANHAASGMVDPKRFRPNETGAPLGFAPMHNIFSGHNAPNPYGAGGLDRDNQSMNRSGFGGEQQQEPEPEPQSERVQRRASASESVDSDML